MHCCSTPPRGHAWQTQGCACNSHDCADNTCDCVVMLMTVLVTHVTVLLTHVCSCVQACAEEYQKEVTEEAAFDYLDR